MPDPPVPGVPGTRQGGCGRGSGTRRSRDDHIRSCGRRPGSLLAAIPDLLPQLKRPTGRMRELDWEVVTEL
jgi:hypothetical protein